MLLVCDRETATTLYMRLPSGNHHCRRKARRLCDRRGLGKRLWPVPPLAEFLSVGSGVSIRMTSILPLIRVSSTSRKLCAATEKVYEIVSAWGLERPSLKPDSGPPLGSAKEHDFLAPHAGTTGCCRSHILSEVPFPSVRVSKEGDLRILATEVAPDQIVRPRVICKTASSFVA